MRVVYHRRAARSLRRIPANRARQIMDAVDAVAAEEDPGRAANVRAMAGGSAGRFRLRVGEYRVVFSVEKDEQDEILLVTHATTRGDAYR